jgi:hypothetical protein
LTWPVLGPEGVNDFRPLIAVLFTLLNRHRENIKGSGEFFPFVLDRR